MRKTRAGVIDLQKKYIITDSMNPKSQAGEPVELFAVITLGTGNNNGTWTVFRAAGNHAEDIPDPRAVLGVAQFYSSVVMSHYYEQWHDMFSWVERVMIDIFVRILNLIYKILARRMFNAYQDSVYYQVSFERQIKSKIGKDSNE